jgi:hypothetical protein
MERLQEVPTITQARRIDLSSSSSTIERPLTISSSFPENCPYCLLAAPQLGIPDNRVRKGDFKPHVILCRGRDSSGNPLGIEDTCLVVDCTTDGARRSTAAAWDTHYRRKHNINITKFQDLKSLRRFLQPWHAPDFDMNGDWGYFLTKKSPIQEFKHLTEYWGATSDPLMFRVRFQHQVVRSYRHDFTRILQATPISWHAHASDVWAVIPSVLAVLEEVSPVRRKGLLKIQKDHCRLATFESQMLSYYGPMV